MIQQFCLKQFLGFGLFFDWGKCFITGIMLHLFVIITDNKFIENRINIKYTVKLQEKATDIYKVLQQV